MPVASAGWCGASFLSAMAFSGRCAGLFWLCRSIARRRRFAASVHRLPIRPLRAERAPDCEEIARLNATRDAASERARLNSAASDCTAASRPVKASRDPTTPDLPDIHETRRNFPCDVNENASHVYSPTLMILSAYATKK
ncbi:hypothetical protein PT2222_30070 [Paraburkholderia tropica]